jgi:hypothetical protein
MRIQSGVCAMCGRESDRLRVWTHRQEVGVQYVPRYTVALIDVRLCPDCRQAALNEAEAASDMPRAAIGLAGALALTIGLLSVAGPPFWPAVFRWIRGPSREETAAAVAQMYGAPVVYKPHVLVPPTQSQDGR